MKLVDTTIFLKDLLLPQSMRDLTLSDALEIVASKDSPKEWVLYKSRKILNVYGSIYYDTVILKVNSRSKLKCNFSLTLYDLEDNHWNVTKFLWKNLITPEFFSSDQHDTHLEFFWIDLS